MLQGVPMLSDRKINDLKITWIVKKIEELSTAKGSSFAWDPITEHYRAVFGSYLSYRLFLYILDSCDAFVVSQNRSGMRVKRRNQ
jgi:hypothetical protein